MGYGEARAAGARGSSGSWSSESGGRSIFFVLVSVLLRKVCAVWAGKKVVEVRARVVELGALIQIWD
jgi:hypothetical protein